MASKSFDPLVILWLPSTLKLPTCLCAAGQRLSASRAAGRGCGALPRWPALPPPPGLGAWSPAWCLSIVSSASVGPAAASGSNRVTDKVFFEGWKMQFRSFFPREKKEICLNLSRVSVTLTWVFCRCCFSFELPYKGFPTLFLAFL